MDPNGGSIREEKSREDVVVEGTKDEADKVEYVIKDEK